MEIREYNNEILNDKYNMTKIKLNKSPSNKKQKKTSKSSIKYPLVEFNDAYSSDIDLNSINYDEYNHLSSQMSNSFTSCEDLATTGSVPQQHFQPSIHSPILVEYNKSILSIYTTIYITFYL
jgi:hypothetical protein